MLTVCGPILQSSILAVGDSQKDPLQLLQAPLLFKSYSSTEGENRSCCACECMVIMGNVWTWRQELDEHQDWKGRQEVASSQLHVVFFLIMLFPF